MCSERNARYLSTFMEDVRIAVSGGEINVWHRSAAKGSPTVVLVHGLTGTSRWWIPVISHLPDDRGLITLDARGRGQSRKAPAPYDLGALAEDAILSMDHLGIDEAVIAGYSMGAWIAALAAIHHPGRVSRLVLVDGGLATERDPDLDAEEALSRAVEPSLARLDMEFEDRSAYFEWWQRHPSLSGRWRPELESVFVYDLHEVGGSWRVRANRDAIIVAGRGLIVDEEMRNVAREVEVPARLLVVDHGMLDQPGGFVPLDVARDAAAGKPHIEVSLHRELNHFTLMLGDGAPAVARAVAGD
jgi:pimeloyl-ACP methyl ester carboxylesterase